MRKFVRNYRDSRDGNVAILFALSLLVVMLGVSVALDLNAVTSQKRTAQDRVDSATLAAAVDSNSQSRLFSQRSGGKRINSKKWVEEYITPYFKNTTTISCDDFILTAEDIRLECRGVVNSIFAGLTDKDQLEFNVASTVTLGKKQNLEIALVVDISDSMAASGSLRSLERALVDFVNHDVFDPNTDTSSLSLIPFANTVSFDPSMEKLVSSAFGYNLSPNFVGCFMPDTGDISNTITGAASQTAAPLRFSNKGNPFCPPQSMSAEFFITDTRSLGKKVSNIEPAHGTGSDEALAWGYRALLPSMNGVLSKGSVFPRAFGAENKKIIIFFTDGKPVHKQWTGKIKTNKKKSEKKLLATCNFIKNSGSDIDLYTIGFGSLARSGTDLSKLLNQCTNGNGYFVNANKSNLSATLLNIIPSVQELVITN